MMKKLHLNFQLVDCDIFHLFHSYLVLDADWTNSDLDLTQVCAYNNKEVYK